MIARKDSFRQEGMNRNSNSRSPPVNGLVEKAEKLQVSFALGEGGGEKKAKRKSFSETTAFEKLLSHRFIYRSADQVGVSFISEETEGRDSLAVGSSRRGRKLC
jgi:hypothetical protein